MHGYGVQPNTGTVQVHLSKKLTKFIAHKMSATEQKKPIFS